MEVYSNEAIYLLALRRNQAVPVLVIRPHTGDPFWLAVEVTRKPDHVTVRWWEEDERGIYHPGGIDSAHVGSVMGVVHMQSSEKNRLVLTWKLRAKITGIVMADRRATAQQQPKRIRDRQCGKLSHPAITKVTPPAQGGEPCSDIANEGSSTPAERIREAAGQRKSTVSTYQTYFNLFSSVCRSQAIDPWVYSEKTALAFMAYMLERETHGRVCHDIRPYFTVANHFYEARGHGRPWAAKPVRVLCKGYQRARSAASKAEGRKPPNSRVTIPHTVIQRMCEEDERQNAAWKAVFLIMLLTGMRADSVSALQPTNVRFVDGAMIVDVLRCKTDDEARTKVVRAPRRVDHFRHRAFAIIQSGAQSLSAGMFGSHPSEAITDAMQRYVVPGELVEGSYVSSHSWRKTGASILWRDNAGMVAVLAYGGWAPSDRTYRTVMRYVDKQYANTPHMTELMDAYHTER